MKYYNKIMSSFVYSKKETKDTFDLALKEVLQAKDGKALISLAKKYAKRAFDYPKTKEKDTFESMNSDPSDNTNESKED